ncbi:hypothetical protein BVG16_15625 [Paenibacillus selenitireducens]|uniref:Phage portal protein n=1 Tax=Paenibacillus selenitireducens TaxID=1324314 RepID=A0A1T2X9T3_9BACL|nr:YmfQ family protein [Paenibacillus selenitireducens]OPA76610.1 hypothetical protein BVG16_15625 [Paenibacillus selenitireducens]
MYGQYQYGTLQYGAETEKGSPIDIFTPDLLEYLPKYWYDITEMVCIQDTAAAEIGTTKFSIDDVLKQVFVKTATWGLELWERELGLTTDNTKPYERRREMILAKLRGSGTTTKEMIKSVAAAFSGGEVKVFEYPSEYRFEVQFIGVMGIPPNMAGLMQVLEEVKPAHLTYNFKYSYTWWDTLKQLTWQQANSKSWSELRTYKGE